MLQALFLDVEVYHLGLVLLIIFLDLLLKTLQVASDLPHLDLSLYGTIANRAQLLHVLDLYLIEVVGNLLLLALVVHLGFCLASLELFPLLRELPLRLLNLLATLRQLLTTCLQGFLLAADLGLAPL